MPRIRTPLTREQVEKQLSLKRPEFREAGYVKRCACCYRQLPADDFWVCPSRYDGRSTFCKTCDVQRRNARRRKRVELVRVLKEHGAGTSNAYGAV